VATYAYDLRWHGTYPQHNPGGKLYFHTNSYAESVADLHAFYQWVRAKHPDKPVFVISHSNGGLIALLYGLTSAKDTDIKGFIVSSPWLKNKVKVPVIMQKLAGVIAALHPTFTITPPAITDKLTHDEKITARHFADEAAGLRGKQVTAKLGTESAKTQSWVSANLKSWQRFPVFAVIAGNDLLAEPQAGRQILKTIPSELLTLLVHENNFHENFNEVNRNESFTAIWDWMQPLLSGGTSVHVTF
jgi:alpha-beta hydrolase superfamily lysophospholipase